MDRCRHGRLERLEDIARRPAGHAAGDAAVRQLLVAHPAFLAAEAYGRIVGAGAVVPGVVGALEGEREQSAEIARNGQ